MNDRHLPRVFFVCGRAYHRNSFQIGAFWGRLPSDARERGAIPYRVCFVVHFNVLCWRGLKDCLKRLISVEKHWGAKR
jgi:hypothetical protein